MPRIRRNFHCMRFVMHGSSNFQQSTLQDFLTISCGFALYSCTDFSQILFIIREWPSNGQHSAGVRCPSGGYQGQEVHQSGKKEENSSGVQHQVVYSRNFIASKQCCHLSNRTKIDQNRTKNRPLLKTGPNPDINVLQIRTNTIDSGILTSNNNSGWICLKMEERTKKICLFERACTKSKYQPSGKGATPLDVTQGSNS